MNWTQLWFVQRWLNDLKGEWQSKEWGKQGREKNYQGWVSVNLIRLAVSANWQLSKLGFCSPMETGRHSSYLPDDYISKEEFSDPWKRHSWIIGDVYNKRDRGRIHNCKLFFSKCSEEGWAGTYQQVLAGKSSRFF